MTNIVSVGNVTLRPYQCEARKALDLLAFEVDDFSTCLAVGTGGGKTKIAIDFITSTRLKQGYQCLWLVGSNYLVDQACQEVTKYYSKTTVERINRGNPLNPNTASSDYIMMTYQYAIRHLDDIKKYLKNKTIQVVIDEAHHVCANSYLTLLSVVKEVANKVSLLGLTATPYRTDENEDRLLGNIFTVGVENGKVSYDTGIVYKMSTANLIKQGYLAKPFLRKIVTDILDEEVDDLEEYETSLAENDVYNASIIKHYLDNKAVYGQTIIFAINCRHAVTLWQTLCAAGVGAGIAISATSSSTSEIYLSENMIEQYIQDFRDGRIDVIITCQMLTEGYDVPLTKTVIIAKPMTSPIECSQCIGRALRKKEDDNSAYIVYMDTSAQKLNVRWYTPDIETGLHCQLIRSSSNSNKNMNIDFTGVLSSVKLYLEMTASLDGLAFESADNPYGFYLFKGKEGINQIIVYDSNHKQFERFLSDLDKFDSIGITSTVDEINAGTSAIPITDTDIKAIIDYYKRTSKLPVYYPVGKETSDLLSIKHHAEGFEDIPTKQMKASISELWEQHLILQNYYEKVNDFVNAVIDAM